MKFNRMDNFLQARDSLSREINQQATVLYNRIRELDIDALPIPEKCRWYLGASHLNRLFFSIQTSAHLLYRAVIKKGKPIDEVILMDYGAGVGTLYMLAKMSGCKRVIYNDYLEEWKETAYLIAEACSVSIDEYIVEDIENTMRVLKEKNISCDIITSRNVVEHIYKLDKFFNCIYSYSPNTLIYSSTTANFQNPASRIKHYLWHRKWEKEYRQMRLEKIIQKGVSDEKAVALAKSTRGLAMEDLDKAIEDFKQTGVLPRIKETDLNTCEPSNGLWAEHIMSMKEYRELVDPNKYRLSFEPGFWDTHYSSNLKNILGNVMNTIGKLGKAAGMGTASFIYVIAEPIDHKQGDR